LRALPKRGAEPSNKEEYQSRKPSNVKNKRIEEKYNHFHKDVKSGRFNSECPNKKVSFKSNHVCAGVQVLEGGFVAKASSFKPQPILLYLEAKISGRNLLCLVDTKATHSFMNLK
jgi:ClpP class serine protease